MQTLIYECLVDYEVFCFGSWEQASFPSQYNLCIILYSVGWSWIVSSQARIDDYEQPVLETWTWIGRHSGDCSELWSGTFFRCFSVKFPVPGSHVFYFTVYYPFCWTTSTISFKRMSTWKINILNTFLSENGFSLRSGLIER